MNRAFRIVAFFVLVAVSNHTLTAQPPDGPPPGGGPMGGFGPPMAQHRKIMAQFDKDGDGRLNKAERQAAREFLKKERESGGRGFGGPRGGFGPRVEPGKPGPHVAPDEVSKYPDAPLYDPSILRTLFLQFEDDDWEAELADFYHTDIEVPATLIVDGKKYPDVGVHFRGMSSFMMIPAGSKRSLGISLDHADKKQRLYGYKSLNLLNSHEDASFLSTALYSHIARQYIPAPKANLAKVVINGESWGVYTNAQQFDKIFLNENFKSTKGARWKVTGSPGGGGGLEYVGDNVEQYKRRYDLKSGDESKAWPAFIKLCKTLNQTPPDQLEAALAPMLDIDGLLWFLALDCAVINCDGYWIRASDYSIYLDEHGKFHVIPHDMNECFRAPQGPGFGGGPGGPGGGMMVRMGAPGELLPAPVQEMLNLSEDQKKQLRDLQKVVDGKIAKILSTEQARQLRDLRERGPGGMAFGGGPGGTGGGPGGGRPGRGPGGPGGGPGMSAVRGVELDPLVGIEDSRKPLRSKILAVPALRARYLQNVKTIADQSFDWNKLGPVVRNYRSLIEKEVEADTRRLDSFADFKRATADNAPAEASNADRRRPEQTMNLRAFADQRRKYLLEFPEIRKLGS